LNGFENGKTQLFNCGGVVKFPKIVEYPFKVKYDIDSKKRAKRQKGREMIGFGKVVC